MGYRQRICFSSKQKAEIWDRWQRGESIYPLLSRTGGIRPPERRRSRLALTLAEREEISRGLKARHSLRIIARQLHRSPSTISREVRRNGGRLTYRATVSDAAAWDRALRPKRCKLACQPGLCRTVSGKLQRKWSPQQIAGWLEREHQPAAETILPRGKGSFSALTGQAQCRCPPAQRKAKEDLAISNAG